MTLSLLKLQSRNAQNLQQEVDEGQELIVRLPMRIDLTGDVQNAQDPDLDVDQGPDQGLEIEGIDHAQDQEIQGVRK